MTKGLTGIPSLAYLGVNAGSPPNIKMYDRSPGNYDCKNFIIGDLWINTTPSPATTREIWMLVALLGNTATWVKLYPGSGGGGGGDLRSEDLLIATATPLNYINVYGTTGEDWDFALPGNNISTYRIDANTLGIGLTTTINQPMTNSTATQGMYKLGGTDFLHAYGTENTWCGLGAGNLTFDPAQAQYNSAFGFVSLAALTSGRSNTAIGSGVLTNSNGSYNLALGALAGDNYIGAESSSILLAHPGVTGESNVIRCGVMGNGAGQQNKCVIAGIWNGTDNPAKNNGITVCDEDGMLYVADIADNSIVTTNATGRCTGLKGAVGTVLTGHGAGALDPAPEFLPIESSGGSVTITTNPVTGAINLEAAGVAALTQLTTDTGAALPAAGNINVLGGELINTDNVVANTVTINLDRSTQNPAAKCEIVTGMGPGAASIYKELFCSDGSILFDLVSDPTKIDITAPGGGGGALATLTDEDDVACVPVLANIKIDAGDNIETTTMAPGVLEVRVTDNVDLFGWLHSQLEVRTTAGDLVADAGNLKLPATSATAGAVYINSVAGVGGDRFLHGYQANNVFLGKRAGNVTMDVTSFANVGIGLAALEALGTGAQYNCATGFASQSLNQSGSYNSSYGQGSLGKLTSGTYNSAFSAGSLGNLLTGSRNFAAGYSAGSALAGSESDNVYLQNNGVLGESHVMRLGTSGSGNGQVNACYVAGVYGASDGPSKLMVVCGSDGKLSTDPFPTGTGINTLTGNTGTATGSTVDILGRYNTSTTATANNVLIDLDYSISQNNTTAAGEGIYALGAGIRGTNAYVGNRFMHNYGTSSTFLGYQAGPISGVGGTNLVGIGTNALDAAAGAQSCVAIGKNALTNAVTAKNVVAIGSEAGALVSSPPGGSYGEGIYIGSGAGNLYTTNYWNITIGNSFTSSENALEDKATRIGYRSIWSTPAPTPHDPFPVETETTVGTDSTRIYGIYNRSVASSGQPVYIDHTGKMGTEGGVMAAFRQTTSLSNITGDGTVYIYGVDGGITVDFDNTSSLSSFGAGAAIVFTAPYTGIYVIGGSVTMSIPASPPVPRVTSVDPLYIVTDNNSYTFTAYLPPSTTSVQYVSEVVNTVVALDAGEHVYWASAAGDGTLAKNISIVNYLAQTFPAPISAPKTCYATYFYIYRIS